MGMSGFRRMKIQLARKAQYEAGKAKEEAEVKTPEKEVNAEAPVAEPVAEEVPVEEPPAEGASHVKKAMEMAEKKKKSDAEKLKPKKA